MIHAAILFNYGCDILVGRAGGSWMMAGEVRRKRRKRMVTKACILGCLWNTSDFIITLNY